MSNNTGTVDVPTLKAFAAAWNRHDVDALMTFMADDCVFETAAGPDACGTRHVGREAVRKAFEAVWIALPDVQWADDTHFVQGDRGVSEWTFKATRPDGTRVEQRGCDLFTFKGGKILVKSAFRKDRPALPARG